MLRSLGSIAASLTLAFPASATVWIVDPSGGGDFTDIQSAVDAAVDGDTILVLDGTYGKVLVDGKGLTIEGLGSNVKLQGSLQILNTQPAQANVVERLQATGLVGFNEPDLDRVGLNVDACSGPVTALDCQFTAANQANSISGSSPGKKGLPGVLLTLSPNVELIRCKVVGGRGGNISYPNWAPAGGDGGHGIQVANSNVTLCEVVSTGGTGGESGNFPGTGGDALHASSSAALSVNGTYTGGTGGAAWDIFASIGGQGGDAIHSAASAQVTSFGDELFRGPGGFCFVMCPAGKAGKQVNKTGGGKVQFLGPYCTPSASASGCQASIGSTGTPSASATSGFVLLATGAEGQKQGQFFFSANGKALNAWGNSQGFVCVAAPVRRGALLDGSGTLGACDGAFSYDLNAHWSQKPVHNPGSGSLVQAQLWYRDPQSTSNQDIALSDAIEFPVCP